MVRQSVRPAAVAGTWYPGTADTLRREVDDYLSRARAPLDGRVVAVVAPHAGLVYSGPVAAFAYGVLAGRSFDVAVLVGPSHFVAFEGVAAWDGDAFETPLGLAPVDREVTSGLVADSPIVRAARPPHVREHSLEMQLPFLMRVLPDVPIVPLLMGHQERHAIEGLARALARVLAGRSALLVASTDLSHYLPADRARVHDGRVSELVGALDADGLLHEFEGYPEGERGRFVGCGIGPAIAVMRAAAALGAEQARVLRYAHSGDVSGDHDSVVGYLAAAFGSFAGRSSPAPDADADLRRAT